MHNGEALYARDAGKSANADDAAKLDGLAPEAYIQPQDGILDNGYFKINQKGETEYSTFGISVDRWAINRAIVKVYADCISLRWNGTDRDSGNIFERIERDALLPNAIYTFSVLVKDVGLLSVTFTTKTEAPSEPIFIAQKRFGDLELSVHDTPESYQFNVYTYSTKESYLKAAKAEPGAYFTGWPVWNYALELAKCQRYFWRQSGVWIPAGIATAMGSNVAHTYISYPVPFRTTPSIRFNKLYLNGTGAFTTDAIPITRFRFGKNSNGNALIVIECSGGLTPGTSYVVTSREDSDAYLEFNANL